MSDHNTDIDKEDSSTAATMEEKSTGKKSAFKKVIIAFLVILAITIITSGSIVYFQLNKMHQIKLDKSDKALGIKPEVQAKFEDMDNQPLNIALFGIDKDDPYDDDDDKGRGKSDSIMIISINKQTGDIKFISIMRDTYVNIPGRGMDKINHAYAYGGPQLAISTINSNFNMNIKDFATVTIAGMEKVINQLGGVDIYVSKEELPYIYGHHDDTQEGMKHLTGRQAVDYAQIRAVGNSDYERTERQRTVLSKIAYKIQAAGPKKLPVLVSRILPNTTTSFSKTDVLKIGAVVFAYKIKNVEQMRLPLDSASEGKLINGIYYLWADLDANTLALHDFIYNDTKPAK